MLKLIKEITESLFPTRKETHRTHVLLVVANDAYRTLWCQVLEATGAQVQTATTATEALHSVEESDIMFLDGDLNDSTSDVVVSAWLHNKVYGPYTVLLDRMSSKRLRELYRNGAYNVLPKTIGPEIISSLAYRYIADIKLFNKVDKLEKEVLGLRRLVFILIAAALLTLVTDSDVGEAFRRFMSIVDEVLS